MLNWLMVFSTLFPVLSLFAQDNKVPPGNPAGMYDESKIPQYTLPDPLVMSDGRPVIDATMWSKKRRPEVLKSFETNVYGKAAIGRPEEMHWETKSVKQDTLGDSTVRKNYYDLLFQKENVAQIGRNHHATKDRETGSSFSGFNVVSGRANTSRKRIRSCDIRCQGDRTG